MVKLNHLISLKKVSKVYTSSSETFTALKEIDLQVNKGEFVAFVGQSGSGKSTLINMITGIDTPSSGEVYVASKGIHSLNQEQMAVWRGKNIGVIFQSYQLLPTLTVVENIMLPMDFCKTYPRKERRKRAIHLLSKMGIAEKANNLPSDLSGGQQQRAAIARALANDPPILVADEPTGNLDSATTNIVMNLFTDLISEGKTIVMVTHERDLSHFFTRSVLLSDGEIVSETSREKIHHV
ncbi:ABC transporter ATP-binding protein [Chengkuizengella sediminis]|uniref:ABC transporter ATP-binding protein n=1 Tax=Chengkuizengella sediminis TaxID=1885917 RepID=UPI001389B444|nr:ABC transporter ATP-binding protein [Chengkuizengella sediminis]NDI35572.1 ABC transporter ATP-binding protein [Chengkuizengella sediminis]